MLLRLRPLHFFAAFAVGLLFCYIATPPPKVVVKFPTPYNAGQVVYKDDVDTCFKFNADRVECPADGSAKPQPLTESGPSAKSGTSIAGGMGFA